MEAVGCAVVAELENGVASSPLEGTASSDSARCDVCCSMSLWVASIVKRNDQNGKKTLISLLLQLISSVVE